MSVAAVEKIEMPAQESVPYETIDPEIRGLVRLLNQQPGLRTAWSCAGHGPEDEAYVILVAEDQETVRDLLGKLPFVGWNAGFADNQPVSKVIWITLDMGPAGELRYKLRLGANPSYRRNQLIAEVEAALRAAPAR